MNKTIHDWKKRELLKLPFNRDSNVHYESFLLVPDGKKHESGWGWIAMIGLIDDIPTCIAGYCDSLTVFDKWDIEHGYSDSVPHVRFDATYPSGILHLWVRGYDMSVDGYSSSDIRYHKRLTNSNTK